ncbi:reverse transcriptase domain-containing protein [Tanacetum coccineum]|uniref:Reverse transcriptase domain-containing protein n=1 Tax=Tanacetum coccineum TaxID=301880 RepID=A0ABQ5D1L0_9ASTR
MASCKHLNLDGLIIVEGVTSNTDAAQLAETFAEAKCATKKMAQKKRTTRASPATTTTTTTPVTNAQLKALIDQGIADALAARNGDKSMNGDDSHNSGTGVRRQVPLAREGEIKKLEVEMWNLKVKGTDVVGYNQRFQELALMCTWMFHEESDKIKKYVDKKISTPVERQAENKRKLDNNNQAQQQPLKKQGVAIAYTVGSGERKEYAETLPLYNKCKFHHNGQCIVKCANCKRVGHLTRDCKSPAATNNQRNLTCYECGNQGHYRNDCPELKNQNHGN